MSDEPEMDGTSREELLDNSPEAVAMLVARDVDLILGMECSSAPRRDDTRFHREELLGKVALLRTERDALVEHLAARGHEVAPSDANFILFRSFSDRDTVFEALLARGVLIRAVGPAGWLRVSIGTPENNAAFRTALEEADPR